MTASTRTLLLIGTVSLLATSAGYFITPIETRFLTTLTDNTFLIGLTFGVGSFVFGLLAIWLGRLSDKHGRSSFILPALVLGIVYPLLYASVHNIFLYMGVKVAWAFSAAIEGPVLMASFQDHLKDLPKRGHYLGLLYSWQAIAGALAQFLGGVLSDKFGITTPYYAMSAMFVVATILVLFVGLHKNKDPLPAPVADEDKRGIFFGIAYIFKKPELLFYWVHGIVSNLNWGIKVFLWPLIIYGFVGKDTITGSIFGSMGLVAFIILLFGGKLTDRFGSFVMIRSAVVILGLSGMVLAATGHVGVFWIAALCYAVGEALFGPAHGILFTDNVDSRNRGEVLGADTMLGTILATASPFIAGALLLHWSAQTVLALYVSFFFIALLAGEYMYIARIQK